MNLKDNPQLLRAIIMDHYEYPRNKKMIDDNEYYSKHMDSASCIDNFEVFVKIVDGIVSDIAFEGVGCTISTASTSIMSELLVNKTLAQAQYIINEFNKMLQGEVYDEEALAEAVAFYGVGKQASRINCASIGWRAMELIIKENEEI